MFGRQISRISNVEGLVGQKRFHAPKSFLQPVRSQGRTIRKEMLMLLKQPIWTLRTFPVVAWKANFAALG